MEPTDYLKLIYQNEFGVEHLIFPSREDMLSRLQTELAQAKEEGYAPQQLCEDIGNGLCRLYLDPRVLTEEDLPLVLRCFLLSAGEHGTAEGFWHKVGQWEAMTLRGDLPAPTGGLEDFLARYDGRCAREGRHIAVSHSDRYRAAYTPHYRVMARDLGFYFPALLAIHRAFRGATGPVIAAIDGRCASGKSTFAARAAEVFEEASLFHMDDFFLPFAKRTPERLAQPGGNVDYERAAQELFQPLSRGEAVSFHPYNCHTGDFDPNCRTSDGPLAIVEGSYSLHPVLTDYSQVKIFLTCSPQTQLDRLAARESEKSYQNFIDKWIPMEEAYFQAFPVQESCAVVLDTTDL